jgi:hypothetical protein
VLSWRPDRTIGKNLRPAELGTYGDLLLHSSASTMQRRPEFSFPGSPVNARPREEDEEEVRWLQASRQGSPDSYYYHNNNSSGRPSPQLWAEHQSRASPPSRAHAIAGYRREMLDLVRGLPESAYELSLRDIVEHHHPSSLPSSPPSSAPLPTPPPPPSSSNTAIARDHGEPAADDPAAKQSGAAATRKKQGRRTQRSRSLERSVSLDTGLLIKFFLPLSIVGGRGGKKAASSKPDAAKHSKKKQGTKEEEARQKHDGEWWTKREFSEEASGSSSRTSSTGSSNSNNSSGSGSNPRPPVRSRRR